MNPSRAKKYSTRESLLRTHRSRTRHRPPIHPKVAMQNLPDKTPPRLLDPAEPLVGKGRKTRLPASGNRTLHRAEQSKGVTCNHGDLPRRKRLETSENTGLIRVERMLFAMNRMELMSSGGRLPRSGPWRPAQQDSEAGLHWLIIAPGRRYDEKRRGSQPPETRQLP